MQKSNNHLNLPRIFHIGMQRSGSTFLYNHFREHPQISLSPLQEIHFYSKNYEKGIEWYLKNFPEGEGKVKIDTSPKYFMQGEVVAPRIETLVGKEHPKFILILRNPIDYVHSHFQMHLKGGYFRKNSQLYPKVTRDIVDFIERYPRYIERGFYYKILRDYWLEYFDLDQFLIIIFEEFIRNDQIVIKKIYEWIGVEPLATSPSPVSQNRMLRYSFLYPLQSKLIRFGNLKKFVKQNRCARELYMKLFTASSDILTKEQREFLKEQFEDDVRRLWNIISHRSANLIGHRSAWRDFVG